MPLLLFRELHNLWSYERLIYTHLQTMYTNSSWRIFIGIHYWTAESQYNVFQTVKLIHISISIWDEKNQYRNKECTLTLDTRWTCVSHSACLEKTFGLYYHILRIISKSISSNLWQNIPTTNNTFYHHSNRGSSLVEYTHHISQHSSPYTVKIKERVCG